ncbi:MAG: endonuclease/exonuclease/phosphatase family protein, partial [Candidatus Krumholzibacteriia bacterium]
MRHGSTAGILVAALVTWAGSSADARAEEDASAARVYRVMSFNIRYGTANDGPNAWDHRKELLLGAITRDRPDLLGVQECLLFQAEFLQEHLPGYDFVGAGRDDGRAAGEMCAIFFRRDRFEKLDEGHFWLSETPEVPGSKSWDSALPRVASWVKLGTRDDSLTTIHLFNTHFDHAGEKARLESAKLLRRRVSKLCRGAPAIICGDFNAPADAGGPYRALVLGTPDEITRAEESFVDTYRRAHPARAGNEGTFNAFRGESRGPRIDWIVVSKVFDVLEAAIDRRND